MQSKRVVSKSLQPTFVPCYLLQVEFIHAKILNECTYSTFLNKHYTFVMQSGHGENSQAEGGVEESEPDKIFTCHSQPTILSEGC